MEDPRVPGASVMPVEQALWSSRWEIVTSAVPISNVVLVHGAFVDGSGWRAAYDLLAS
jgi:hypothetical protein